MSDPVETPSKTPNQPAVETPAAAATPVAATPAAPTVTPVTETPAASAATPETPPDEAAAAKAASDKAAAEAAVAAAPQPTEAEAAAAKATADAEAAKAAAAAAVPETYEIKLPNGVQVDPALLPTLSPALKQAGLSQTQLQTVAEAFIEFQTKVPQRMLERDLEVTMKDPELGGLNYGRTQGHVNAALGAFTTPEFRSLLAKTGLANNLEFVRVFERIGKAMSGDAPARGTPDGAPQMSRAERMYGKTTPTT